MEYLIAFGSLLGGLLLLAYSGDRLISGAANLALRLKISPLFIGITVVAAGTSLPELVVCVIAQFEDSSGLAIGNILGSNIFNIGMVLGTVLIFRRRSHIQGGVLEAWILIVSTLALLIYLQLVQEPDGTTILTRSSGIIMVIAFLFLLAFIYRTGRKNASVIEELQELVTDSNSLKTNTLLILGTLGLWLGGEFLVDGAVSLARLLDIQETTIGLTIVAAGTGAPELFASLAALRKGSASIAIGNVVGSNLFNTIAIVGAAAIVNPLQIHLGELRWDLIVMIIMTLSIAPVLGSGRSPRFQKSIGVILLLLYGIWLLSIIIEKH